MNCLMRKQYNSLKHIMFQIILNCSIIFILHLYPTDIELNHIFYVVSYIHLSVFIDRVIDIHSFYSRTILSLSILTTNWSVNLIELDNRNGNIGSFEYSPSHTNDPLYSFMYQIININNQ